MPSTGQESVHLQIEAQKLAFADAWRYVADIDYMKEVRLHRFWIKPTCGTEPS